MRDLVKADKWEWSTEPWLKKGVPIQYFTTHPDPVVQEIYAKMQWLELEKAVQKVMKGRFSMIIYENYIAPIIATRYTDLRGRTPFYISKETFPVMASVGWSFRKGLPIYRRMNELMHSLRDAGIIAQWTQEVMANRVRAEKGDKKIESFDVLNEIQKEYTSGIPLGVGHLQGAFILFSFGSVVGLLSFVMEFFFA
ncbi:uncharacterized protein LOC135113916 [Scylla paramamosain]|uniref:uncharacterized protein LOC135113916 n=1 Tax=Scylla paramamosain TaxID=85552 RepID=UPI00308286F2